MSAIETLSLDHIARGLVQPDIAAFWRQWREVDTDRPGLSAFATTIQDRMTLSEGRARAGFAPELIAVGASSFIAACYGADWAREVALRTRTPDTGLEQISARGYHAAISGEPNLDVVMTTTADDTGRRMEILYERLIVPIRTAGGHLVIGCMTAPLKPICWLSEPGDQDRVGGSSTNNHRREYVQAPLSSLSRSEKYGHSPDGPQSPC